MDSQQKKSSRRIPIGVQSPESTIRISYTYYGTLKIIQDKNNLTNVCFETVTVVKSGVAPSHNSDIYSFRHCRVTQLHSRRQPIKVKDTVKNYFEATS